MREFLTPAIHNDYIKIIRTTKYISITGQLQKQTSTQLHCINAYHNSKSRGILRAHKNIKTAKLFLSKINNPLSTMADPRYPSASGPCPDLSSSYFTLQQVSSTAESKRTRMVTQSRTIASNLILRNGRALTSLGL